MALVCGGPSAGGEIVEFFGRHDISPGTTGAFRAARPADSGFGFRHVWHARVGRSDRKNASTKRTRKDSGYLRGD